MINQQMGSGRESCAAIARPGSGSDPGETCAYGCKGSSPFTILLISYLK
ncbi:hypothetical protein JOD24_000503 [Kroppenstedtia sanguinis]|uniref:Uncharacterized protein n=1 Tax=Kroppenstedtia sanguinis TaxID=1380684 RepID=A0ABW4CAS8_9BACL